MCKVIFDLDLTLVVSSIAEETRRGINWPPVYSLYPRFKLYDGRQEVCDNLRIIRDTQQPGPYKVITLCGSTRFKDQLIEA